MINSLKILRSSLWLALLVSCSLPNQTNTPSSVQSEAATVINLTQTGCQFLETEARDYQYQPKQSVDCKQINSQTLSTRKPKFKPLELKAGKHIFRVTNSDVPYELGFYLRGAGVKKINLPKVSGGGLIQGKTQDYEITLSPGKYVFSCPLNPTPDYPLIVN
ncbi:MAG: hypothetical protein QNJ41_20220 [Xenococcaceae cyanobacterium MO_188.B32]|nr:hypothetical protein [Xenococcaceae cyanobacterium MO_188.B32]